MTVKEYMNFITDKYSQDTIKKIKKATESSKIILQNKLKEFIAEFGENNNFSKFEMLKYKRFKNLIKKYDIILKELEKEKYRLVKNSNIKVYKEVFNLSAFNCDGAGFLTSFSNIPTDSILLAIENPISDLKLPALIKKNRVQNVNIIQNLLAQQIEVGNSYNETAQQLSNIFKIDLSKMERIVRTENHRVKNIANVNSMDEIAKKYKKEIVYTWQTAKDERVREDHILADGQTRKKDEFFKVGNSQGQAPGFLFGIDSAKQNINCRCYTTEKLGGKIINSEYNEKKYQEWKK